MKILIADDDYTSRKIVKSIVEKWGYEAVLASDGEEAWQILQSDEPPQIAILDWMMPGKDGIELCKLLTAEAKLERYIYPIILTSKTSSEDRMIGLEAGAHDYLTKPVDTTELKFRVNIGRRMIEYESEIQEKNRKLEKVLEERDKVIKDLESALKEVKTLSGLLPICSVCKKIRDDGGYWNQIETYLHSHSEAQFSHGLCPDCAQKLYPEYYNGDEQGSETNETPEEKKESPK